MGRQSYDTPPLKKSQTCSTSVFVTIAFKRLECSKISNMPVPASAIPSAVELSAFGQAPHPILLPLKGEKG